MSISEILLSIPIWWINGVLAMLYWTLDHLAELIALLAGAAILLGIDPLV